MNKNPFIFSEIKEKISDDVIEIVKKNFHKKNFDISTLDSSDPEISNILGIYNKYVLNDFYHMKLSYMNGIKKLNLNCMYNLGLYFYEINDICLSNKYFLMFIENKFKINLNHYDDISLNYIIKIFIHNCDENELIDNKMYKILALYHKNITNNQKLQKKYLLLELKNTYDIILDDNYQFTMIEKIFSFDNNKSDEYYYKLLNKKKLTNEDIEITKLLELYYVKINNNREYIKKLYSKYNANGYDEYLLKLSKLYSDEPKLSKKYVTDYKIALLNKNYKLDISNKSQKIINVYIDIFYNNNIEEYDLNDYNISYIYGLYQKHALKNENMADKYFFDSIITKYKLLNFDLSCEKIIIELFNDDDLNIDLTNDEILNIVGLYYEKKINNNTLAEQYYLLAINKLNIYAMYNIAMMYKNDMNKTNLYYKYMKMFYEFKYNLDLDMYSNDTMNEIIKIFSIDNIDNIKKYNLKNVKNYLELEIISLYYEYIMNDKIMANKYYLEMIRQKYKINIDIYEDYYIDILKKINTKEITIKNLLFQYMNDEIIYYIIGVYYEINGDYENYIKYYKQSYKNGYIQAAIKIGSSLYNNINNLTSDEYELMETSLKLAASTNNIIAIELLCKYYDNINNTNEMLKYLLTGIELSIIYCIYRIIIYFESINNYEKMYESMILYINSDKFKKYKYTGEIYYKLYKYLENINYKEAIYCLKKSVKYNYINSFYKLGIYYKNTSNYKKMEKYLKLACDNGCIDSLHELGLYYMNIDDFQHMEKYFLLSIENLCVESMYELGEYYKNNGNDFDSMKKYFDLGLSIDASNFNIIKSYADYYFTNKKFNNALIYFETLYYNNYNEYATTIVECLLNIHDDDKINIFLENEKNNDDDIDKNIFFKCINVIIEHYNDDKSIKYILYGLNIEHEEQNKLYDKLETICKKNYCKMYYLLSTIVEKTQFVINKINLLLKNNKVKFYSNKISLFKQFNNYKDCIVCYENNLHINFECGHEICVECYCNMNDCQYRCNNNKNSVNLLFNRNSENIQPRNTNIVLNRNEPRTNNTSIVLSDISDDEN